VRSHAPLVIARMETINNTPHERFQEMARSKQDRVLERRYLRQHKCAVYGAQAHFYRTLPDGTRELVAAPCRRWSCPACGPENRIRLCKELIRAVEAHHLPFWITVTLVRDPLTTTQGQAKRLTKEWKALCDLFRKRFHRPLRYIWLKEIQANKPHLHLFADSINRRWLRDTWHDLTGAFKVKVKPLATHYDVADRVDYSTKHICKNATVYRTSCGRWRGASKGISLRVRPRRKPGPSEWQRVKRPIIESEFENMPHRVEDSDRAARPTRVIIAPPGGVHEPA
jgi:hypothetical protein